MSYIWRGLTSQNRSGVSSFYLYDSQGSVRNLVNAAGAITDTYLTTAFGVELLTGSGTVNPFRYVGLLGYYRDMPELMQVRARWLAAVLARWLSRAGFEQVKAGEHPYGYANNNPIMNTDPSGLQPGKNPPNGAPRPKPNCNPVVYNCFRDISWGLYLVHHTFFWIHYPCSPKEQDRTIGYGPPGSFDPLPASSGQSAKNPGVPQQPEDMQCITKGTCACKRTSCGVDCVAHQGSRIGKNKDWDTSNYSAIYEHHNCWDFTNETFTACNCEETGGEFWP